MKKVVAIFGSPRVNGNSDILLNQAIKGAEASGAKVEKIVIRDLQIAPCNACDGCFEKGTCVIYDDVQQIYSHLVDADGIIVASPVYFMSVSAQLKAFIDRCQPFWAKKVYPASSGQERYGKREWFSDCNRSTECGR